MSFITQIEKDATDVEQAVVTGLKAAVAYVDNVVVTDIEPELLSALQTALQTFGSSALSSFLGSLQPETTVTTPAAVSA